MGYSSAVPSSYSPWFKASFMLSLHRRVLIISVPFVTWKYKKYLLKRAWCYTVYIYTRAAPPFYCLFDTYFGKFSRVETAYLGSILNVFVMKNFFHKATFIQVSPKISTTVFLCFHCTLIYPVICILKYSMGCLFYYLCISLSVITALAIVTS